jgi:hypothetical protein
VVREEEEEEEQSPGLLLYKERAARIRNNPRCAGKTIIVEVCDADGVKFALNNRGLTNNIKLRFAEKAGRLFTVVSVDGKPAAACSYTVSRKTLDLDAAFTLPAYRRMGLFHRQVDCLIDVARGQNKNSVCTTAVSEW